ncbi:MAG: SAP domain-containing protein [Deltaproteobacteria bacterium]|nr:SAP domain-containing protein [Deltaproteobacteria bacterium]
MTMAEVFRKAKSLGLKSKVGMKKPDLIREIQVKEGNFPCFGTAAEYCDQWLCCFRGDCLGNGKKR